MHHILVIKSNLPLQTLKGQILNTIESQTDIWENYCIYDNVCACLVRDTNL